MYNDKRNRTYNDLEESEWKILEDEFSIPVSDVKKIATDNYEKTNVRVDQIGPYKIAFKTNDRIENRVNYEDLYDLAKPLQEYINLPVYVGGSHSPLSKKMPNEGSDIDIYVITDGYSYKQSKELDNKIKEFIGQDKKYEKCSVGQVEKDWLDLPYFYEAVPIDEKKWWKLSQEELEKVSQEKEKVAIQKMKRKSITDVLVEIEKIYNIKVNRENIINITTTPRWKSINDCGFKRGTLLKDYNKETLKTIMNKLSNWLVYKDENTSLYDAVRYSNSKGMPKKSVDVMTTYMKYSKRNGIYWLFNSMMNSFAEAKATNARKINWILDGKKEEKAVLEKQIRKMSKNLTKYYGKELENNFVDLNAYFNENGYNDKIEELKNANRKYRKICDLDLEVKLYAYCKLNKSNKLFIINPENKVGKILKHSGLNVSIPFINKNLKELRPCPEYAKEPPAGYCVSGAAKVMLGLNDTYKCECDDKTFLQDINEMWNEFKLDIVEKENSDSEQNIQKTSLSIVDRAENSESNKSIILFGSPSIDIKNLLLLEISKLYSDKDTSIIVEDIMAPYLYNDGVYDSKKTKQMYKSLEDKGVQVDFNSEDRNFSENVINWLKRLKIKDLKKVLPMKENSDIYGFHVYDAIHLAIMGVTYEKVKDNITIVQAYNESALHVFKDKIGKNGGYISCHQVPGEFDGKSIRISSETDKITKKTIMEKAKRKIKVVYKDKNSKIKGEFSLVNGNHIVEERKENER